MSETASTMLSLGTKAPSFKLIDTRNNETISLADIKSDVATVVMFISNHCPYVKLILNKLVDVANEYQSKNISFVAISSNDAQNYPADGPEKMRAEAEKRGFTFPYLYDETQEVAKAYHAACTPDFFVFDENLACVFRGRFDGATPGNGAEVTGKDLTNALDNILDGKAVDGDQRPSLGCNIKWKR